MKVGLALYLGAAYGGVKGDLMDAAQVMPDADYGFKAAAAPEMQTYGSSLPMSRRGSSALAPL